MHCIILWINPNAIKMSLYNCVWERCAWLLYKMCVWIRKHTHTNLLIFPKLFYFSLFATHIFGPNENQSKLNKQTHILWTEKKLRRNERMEREKNSAILKQTGDKHSQSQRWTKQTCTEREKKLFEEKKWFVSSAAASVTRINTRLRF